MTITTLYLVHPAEDRKVEEVKAEMRELGPPAICVVDCGDYYMAIEGCHRVMAAAELGIAPFLIVLAQDDLVEVDSLETDFFPPGETYTARKIAGDYWSCRPKAHSSRRGRNAIATASEGQSPSRPPPASVSRRAMIRKITGWGEC